VSARDRNSNAEIEKRANAGDQLALSQLEPHPPKDEPKAPGPTTGAIVEMEAGAAITPGDRLEIDASGRAVVTCEACDAGFRLNPDGLHYNDSRNGATWGVCRKFVAAVTREREEKENREKADDPKPYAVELAERLADRFERKVERWPRNQPIASDIDPDSCLRRQVYEVVAWEKKTPIPADRQGRLEAGQDAERKAMRILDDLDIDVELRQKTFEHRHRKTGAVALRGKIDGVIRVGGGRVLLEVKSLLPYLYPRIRAAEDFDGLWWTKKYPAQLQAYMIGEGIDRGVFLLTDLLGKWNPIPLALDYGYAERVLAFAESAVDAIERHRETGEVPQQSDDVSECARCPFFGSVCNPDMIVGAEGAVWAEDEELRELLETRDKTHRAHSEYDRADKAMKRRLEGAPEALVIGPFMITRKSYPIHNKAKLAKTTTGTRTKVVRVLPDEGGE